MWNWFKTLCSGRPHFIIGGPESPYMLRWYLLPRNRRLNIYLHKFLRDDDDRALHDHPWWFISFLIKGGYMEKTVAGLKFRRRWSWAYRRAEHRHRVILFNDAAGKPVPAWTIVMTGRKSRTWGFWCPKGFVPWYEFVDDDDHGNVGRGCGEMS